MSSERKVRFRCFGGWVSVHVRYADEEETNGALERSRLFLLDAHRRLSRFESESELSKLNRDPRSEVPASALLRRFVAAVVTAGVRSRGLVDGTMLGAIERAGYERSLEPSEPGANRVPRPGPGALTGPARPDPAAKWSTVSVDEDAGTVIRPPGVEFDSGGIAKGLLADLVGESLSGASAYAVDCCGDIRIGGNAKQPRRVRVDDPFGGAPIDELSIATGAIATSGITKRTWIGPDQSAAHQLLDPLSGAPAFTGVVQATALAPSALLAEVHAKAALLSGPEGALEWLPFGGALVLEDGSGFTIAPDHSLPDPVLVP